MRALVARLLAEPRARHLALASGFRASSRPRFVCAGLHAALDARALPFRAGALRAILMTDVFHHVPDAGRFLREASNALRPGWRIIMVEPWVTPWSRFVYGRLHHEPFDPRAEDWTLPPGGPLSAANGARPWIVFARDRERFRLELPALRVVDVAPRLPFRYLLSGGLSMRALLPKAAFGAARARRGTARTTRRREMGDVRADRRRADLTEAEATGALSI